MKNLFYMGGPFFMGILTIVLIVMVAWTIYHILPVLLNKEIHLVKKTSKLKHIKTIGTFGLVTGILGQLIGLSAAFDAIERAGDVAGGILAGGYLLYSVFSGSKKKGSFVGDAIKSYALALALSYAKDLLLDYLASLEQETEAAVVAEESTVNP